MEKADEDKDDDFFPLELIVNRRIREVEGYVGTIKEKIKENQEDEYLHGQVHDAHVILNEYRYIISHKKEILKKCK